MPATPVHPLFALPFARLGLPMSALAIGAMAPDVAYVVDAPWWGQHSLIGIFLFSVPVGLVGLWIYQRIVAPALGLADDFTFTPTPRLLRILAGLTVGAGTHVFVDAFTHYWGWGVAAYPILREGPYGLPAYKLLQYGLSVVGVVILLYWARARLHLLGDLRVLGALVGIGTLAVAHAAFVASSFEGLLGVRVFVVRSVATSLVLAAIALVANGVWFRFRPASLRPPSPPRAS